MTRLSPTHAGKWGLGARRSLHDYMIAEAWPRSEDETGAPFCSVRSQVCFEEGVASVFWRAEPGKLFDFACLDSFQGS